jgi:hypothetical protein
MALQRPFAPLALSFGTYGGVPHYTPMLFAYPHVPPGLGVLGVWFWAYLFQGNFKKKKLLKNPL